MDVSLALLADYANVTADGKLNILGVFDTMFVDHFPVIHPQLHLVLRLEAHPAEAGAQKRVEIRLMTEDGQTALSIFADMAFQRKDSSPLGEMMKNQQIIGFQNVRFEKPGTYQFAILVNGETKSTVALKVQQHTPPQAMPGQ